MAALTMAICSGVATTVDCPNPMVRALTQGDLFRHVRRQRTLRHTHRQQARIGQFVQPPALAEAEIFRRGEESASCDSLAAVWAK